MEAGAEPELKKWDVRSWWPGLFEVALCEERKKARSRGLQSFSKLCGSKSLVQFDRGPLRGETNSCPTMISARHTQAAAALRKLPQPVC